MRSLILLSLICCAAAIPPMPPTAPVKSPRAKGEAPGAPMSRLTHEVFTGASAPTPTTNAILSWTDPLNGPTNYVIGYRLFQDGTNVASVLVPTNSAVASNLLIGKTYTFTVKAWNPAKESDPSPPFIYAPTNDVAPAPKTFTITATLESKTGLDKPAWTNELNAPAMFYVTNTDPKKYFRVRLDIR